MTEAVFLADPTRLLIAAAAGIILFLFLIIKFKFHPGPVHSVFPHHLLPAYI